MQLFYKDGFVYERDETRLSDQVFKKYSIYDAALNNVVTVELTTSSIILDYRPIVIGVTEIYVKDTERQYSILNTYTSFKLLTLEDLNARPNLKENPLAEEELRTHVILESLTNHKGVIWIEKLRKTFLVSGVLAGDIVVTSTQPIDTSPFLDQKLAFNLFI